MKFRYKHQAVKENSRTPLDGEGDVSITIWLSNMKKLIKKPNFCSLNLTGSMYILKSVEYYFFIPYSLIEMSNDQYVDPTQRMAESTMRIKDLYQVERVNSSPSYS